MAALQPNQDGELVLATRRERRRREREKEKEIEGKENKIESLTTREEVRKVTCTAPN